MRLFIMGILLSLIASCSTTKRIADNDSLYDGATVVIKPVNDSVSVNNKELKTELASLVRPAPNKKIFGMRFKLMLYNLAGNPKRKGPRSWIKGMGEPPVLTSGISFDKNRQILQNRLENNGYFRSEVTFDTTTRSKVTKVTYTANVAPQYKIAEVVFMADSSDLGKQLVRLKRRSLLKPGMPYNLDVVKEERERIDARLKERGFYYFNSDYLIVHVDSSIGKNRVNMYLQVKPETPGRAQKIFRINDVVVFADYNFQTDTTTATVMSQAEKFDKYYIYDPSKFIKPIVFSRTLVFKPGDVYNRQAHNLSLNRLTTLGVYKFVKARFQEVDTTSDPRLNTFYYLTPAKKKSIRFEAAALTKSNNTNGSELSVSWRNRNIFKGGELFSATIYGGFEKQVSGQQTNNTNRFGFTLDLLIPRVIAPFHFNTNSGYVPQTQVSFGYELYQRTTQYTLNSFSGTFGYTWKQNVRSENQLKLLSVNYVRPTNITPDFQAQLDTNLTLARSIEKQFILGTIYNYNINTLLEPASNRKKNNFYFNANIDLSGNIIGLITGANANKGDQKLILHTPFSQYSRVELDFRHYLKLGRNTTLASRLLTGMGYSYGNSLVMPFTKEFFAGGTNDLRSYRARSLGPGTYYGGNAHTANTILPDQPGDIKLLASAELRGKLFSILYGAVFVDAGNIWLIRNDSTRPGGVFSKSFINQCAVGTGVGLRLDVKFFVLRLDTSFPLRVPYGTGGPQWVFNQINFGDPQWRKANLVYNLAIGYPF